MEHKRNLNFEQHSATSQGARPFVRATTGYIIDRCDHKRTADVPDRLQLLMRAAHAARHTGPLFLIVFVVRFAATGPLTRAGLPRGFLQHNVFHLAGGLLECRAGRQDSLELFQVLRLEHVLRQCKIHLKPGRGKLKGGENRIRGMNLCRMKNDN